MVLETEDAVLAGRRWFEAAYRAGERDGDALVMARAALGLAGLWVGEHRTIAASSLLRARLRQALRLVDPTGAEALRLRVRLAAEADYQTGDHAIILAMLDEARASPDPLVRTEALRLAHHCLPGPEHGERRRALADELIGEAARGDRRTDLVLGLLCAVVDAFLAADPHAERRLGELRAVLAGEGRRTIGPVVDAIEVMLAIRAGRLPDAERLARDCHERGAKADQVDARTWYGVQLAAIRWYQGRLPELLPVLTELVDSPTLSPTDNSLTAMLALAAATSGDHRTAERLLARLRGRALADLPRSSGWLVTMSGFVETAHLLGNAHAAAGAYQLLTPFADLPAMAGLAVACFGSVHHALGVAALTMGDIDQAVAHLREAIHRNLALGHWPAVALSRQRLAEALARRGHPGEEAAAPRSPAHWATCTRHGRRWRVELCARAVLVDHGVGMLHLAVLIANPNVEITALELAAGLDSLAKATSGSSTQPVLDRTAIGQYRRRLTDLGHDDGPASAREREWVLTELTAGTGLGRRPRAFPDNPERARLAVGRAIRRALTHIERADPTIGAHLRTAIHTGMRCSYNPSPPR